MRSKIKCTFLLTLGILLLNGSWLFAQVSLGNGGGSGYTAVDSYQGVTKLNHYILQMDMAGENLNILNWSIAVIVKSPIRNSEGKVLDPSKVSLRLNNIQGKRDVPTIAQVGAISAKIPLNLAEVPIIPNSQYAIRTGGPSFNNNQWKFSFDLIVEGGAYLESLKSWQNYDMNLEFIFRGPGMSVKTTTRSIECQIYPSGTPPVTPTYSIQVNSNARNGLLEFKTLSDYVNGVSQSYEKGLTIISNTPYAVQVKSLKTNFESGNLTLPIDAVRLEIKDSSSGIVAGTKPLSETTQSLFFGGNMNTQPRSFDIRYFTLPNDQRILNATPANYQSTLLYTLIPQ